MFKELLYMGSCCWQEDQYISCWRQDFSSYAFSTQTSRMGERNSYLFRGRAWSKAFMGLISSEN